MKHQTRLPVQPKSEAKLTRPRIWLEDVANCLPNTSVYLHGFDISSAQYPSGSEIHRPGRNPIPLSVHDVLRPFPAEHHARYDLVHIRLLTAGLKYADYATVLANARDLLSIYTPTHTHPQSILTKQKNQTGTSNGKKSTTQPSAQTASRNTQQ